MIRKDAYCFLCDQNKPIKDFPYLLQELVKITGNYENNLACRKCLGYRRRSYRKKKRKEPKF
ncbi:MAG: hypothetical protein KatS3mg002_1370 [Candidatus Woesearchaeota archaeon]|nr:MAG: hypothetical protein KatS3mg002_1370 [Candidatus Woesearchaeota archaeon]